ncbi:hypothetical protein [Halorussus pelagicus]|uniref:hypothetical protein n=1 Tax=Halorussus pelagicus TaxID=2505977 RepID=UPI001FB79A25|nr:hypothetical protein [Halorussus pelagicus]
MEDYLLNDIRDSEVGDPIPLFDTDEELRVRLNEKERLKRSAQIDTRIRQEGKRCVHENGIRESGHDGLLYVMYQLDAPASDATPADIIPRYIGKTESYGKKRELNSNLEEIAYEWNGTRSFARWGDGDDWHVGELSMAFTNEDDKKAHWKDALFEPESRKLTQQTYLWIRAWSSDDDVGPYGVPATVAEVEPLLIGLAHRAYPEQLLNKDGIPK